MKRLTQEEFIDRCEQRHVGRYDYSKVNYTSLKGKVVITCKIHGDFLQEARVHIDGWGCTACKNGRNTTSGFIEKATSIHGSTYNYSQVVYELVEQPVTIICKLHGYFQQRPSDHLSGKGCKQCGILTTSRIRVANTNNNPGGFILYYDKPTWLYYGAFKIGNQSIYKIGITINPVEDRFKKSLGFEIIGKQLYKTGELAFLQEQKVLQEFQAYKYYGEALDISGNSELFTKDVLNGKL